MKVHAIRVFGKVVWHKCICKDMSNPALPTALVRCAPANTYQLARLLLQGYFDRATNPDNQEPSKYVQHTGGTIDSLRLALKTGRYALPTRGVMIQRI
jgi:hypothetical protein